MFVYFLRKYLFTFFFCKKIDAIDKFRNLNLNFLKIFSWHPSGLKTLKSICQPPVSLIDKRTLICDHIKIFAIANVKVMIDNNVDRMSVNILPFSLDRIVRRLEDQSVDEFFNIIYRINQPRIRISCVSFVEYGRTRIFSKSIVSSQITR
jgi:hypothetical protein